MNCCVTFPTIYKMVSGFEGVTSQLESKPQDLLEILRVIGHVKFIYKLERLNSVLITASKCQKCLDMLLKCQEP